ncbi:MAG: PEGA domain-containing protein [Spirochaetaceae bacterium]|jgi:hypothetical protein|nr:PEGA domain-containing protein [Spirochaetaceae bacterium]
MRRVLFFAWVLFAGLPLGSFADSYDEVEGSGLFVDSEPPGAKVFINGIERGTTPLLIQSIQTGEYTIRVSKEGYVDRRFKVLIRRQSRVEVSVTLEETRGQVLVEIRRDPDAASSLPLFPRILVDGAPVNSPSPPGTGEGLSVPAGWRVIAVEAFGWERISKSIYVQEGSVQRLEFVLRPAPFVLSNPTLKKSRINPKNPGKLGMAELHFGVTGPGGGTLEVLDSGGGVIHTQILGPFSTWQQMILWNGRDLSSVPVPDGDYTIRLSLWGEGQEDRQTAELPLRIDSFLEMRTLTISSGSPGLLLAASPEVLPALSFQIDGNILGGKPLSREAWKGLPFAAGLRISFTGTLEAALVFNLDSEFSGAVEGGAGASIKWIFKPPLRQGPSFFERTGAAAELSYGWAQSGPYTPFGMGTGAALRLPLSYRFLDTPALDLFLGPRILWIAERGYPRDFAPWIGAEGGLYLVRGSFSGGLSLRWDYALPGTEDPGPGPLVSALEFKFAPSNQVLSVLGGFWLWNGELGAFFGAGIGYIY